MIRKGRFAACAAVLFLLQSAVVHRFSHGPLRPDLLWAAAAFLGLEARFGPALWGAFALGLLRDLGSCGTLGAGPLVFVPAVAGLALLQDRLLRESPWTDLALVLLSTLAVGAASALGTWAFSQGGHLGPLAAGAAGQAAFTTALSPLLFAALVHLGVVHGPAPLDEPA